MPLIQVHLDRALYDEKSDEIANAIHEAQVDVLAIPANDRFQIFQPHEPGELRFDPTYGDVDRRSLLVIQITMVARYPVKLKRALYEEIVARLEKDAGVRHEDVQIALRENHYEDWYAGF
ncbi:tautomerase family protein [Georgenia deserti]|uniref:Tautomerase family protein n=1 Tax=Georgenia deserti TaxID=2093781 RepID=A0ABW4KXY2_9MICO